MYQCVHQTCDEIEPCFDTSIPLGQSYQLGSGQYTWEGRGRFGRPVVGG